MSTGPAIGQTQFGRLGIRTRTRFVPNASSAVDASTMVDGHHRHSDMVVIDHVDDPVLAAQHELSIDLAAMPNSHHDDRQNIIVDGVDDPVVPDADP